MPLQKRRTEPTSSWRSVGICGGAGSARGHRLSCTASSTVSAWTQSSRSASVSSPTPFSPSPPNGQGRSLLPTPCSRGQAPPSSVTRLSNRPSRKSIRSGNPRTR
eukprot:scaffold1411_cov252-Pinguiococcus_pyrenoidosus.AAC.1